MLAATAVIGCKTVATYTLKTTGAIAETTIKVGGAVTKTAINTTFDIAGAAFKKGAVTVIDTTTGVSKKVPWSEGLKISSASQTAKLQTATRALEAGAAVLGPTGREFTAETIGTALSMRAFRLSGSIPVRAFGKGGSSGSGQVTAARPNLKNSVRT